MLGDATRLGLKDKSVDYATCTAVTHHLTDTELSAFVHELARVVRCKLILQDAVQSNGWISRLLWKYDRGSHPRSAQALIAALEIGFAIEHVEYYSIYHRYLLVVGIPRPRPGRSAGIN
jgi:ubiquinone/menaquinone biosynthesis C-methylase UbiE